MTLAESIILEILSWWWVLVVCYAGGIEQGQVKHRFSTEGHRRTLDSSERAKTIVAVSLSPCRAVNVLVSNQ